jgi:hypothetical protein
MSKLNKIEVEKIPKKLQRHITNLFARREELKEIQTALEVETKLISAEVMSICDKLDIDGIMTDKAEFVVVLGSPRFSQDLLKESLYNHGIKKPEIAAIMEEAKGDASPPYVKFQFRNGKHKKAD